MSLEYSKARNLSITCKWNSFFLHSTYNPELESERFVENLKPVFYPENIIIIEPALSYCITPLKKKFPQAKLFCIRFISDINPVKQFDRDFFCTENNIDFLENDLFNFFGESGLLNSFFVTWAPSSIAFSELENKVWHMLKKLLTKCKTVLATRQYFANRWIKNQFIFFKNIQQVTKLNKINTPVLICGSGLSLSNSINQIRELKNKVFIIACSSAIKPLLSHNIIPDLCITTDGGYWAKKHLQCLINLKQKTILACPAEAAIPLQVFNNKNISINPLSYNDNLDNIFYEKNNIPHNIGVRNGTVSGTALELALSLTDENIFICGIDLETSKGFVHSQPNELEIQNSLSDNKINPIDNRIFAQGLETPQLELYRNWFVNKSSQINNRVYRVSEKFPFKNPIGKIKDINFNELTGMLNSVTKKEMCFNEISYIKTDTNKTVSYFKSLLNNTEWLENYFPADYLMIKRTDDILIKEAYTKRLKDKVSEIQNFICKQEETL